MGSQPHPNNGPSAGGLTLPGGISVRAHIILKLCAGATSVHKIPKYAQSLLQDTYTIQGLTLGPLGASELCRWVD